MVKFDWTAFVKQNSSWYMLVPARILNDPEFPFSTDEKLIIKIDMDKLIVERAK